MFFPKISWLYWNPSRIFITIPGINWPLTWYGLLFAFGFLIGYFIIISLFEEKLPDSTQNKKQKAVFLADHLLWFVLLGTIVGARVGHILFYSFSYYRENPLAILKIWQGGLASHGGAVGIFLALCLYKRMVCKKQANFSLLLLFDMLCIPIAFVGGCIRIGNFINQEILGTPTTLPWAVIFGNPADGNSVVPRHPVQLYEALSYFVIFYLLIVLWKRFQHKFKDGIISGTFLILIFGMRFLLEFFKLPLSSVIQETSFTMGQILSIPFILLGIALILRTEKKELLHEKT